MRNPPARAGAPIAVPAIPAAIVLAMSCSDVVVEPPPLPPPADASVRLEQVASGLVSPVHLTAPAGDARLFIVEQPGRIRIVRDAALLATPFLDITDRVGCCGERGLLGLAFHPEYGTNGLFFVNYTDRAGDTRVERYRVSGDPDRADPGSASLVLGVEQPFGNHNGGLVVFGADGMLYIGLGDGGSAGDPFGNGQNLSTVLGSILRIDVDGPPPYSIPLDNPFRATAGARPEIWAFGLRNPWRFSFDAEAGRLYVADVGQGSWEEVNAVAADSGGVNYGWDVMEGAHCFGASSCDRTGLVLPVLEYGHGEGCSVTGGHVYRGAQVPALRGHYFYADYCAGWVRSFRLDGDSVVDEREWEFGDIGQILSFGEDAGRELYVLAALGANGAVYRLVPEP